MMTKRFSLWRAIDLRCRGLLRASALLCGAGLLGGCNASADEDTLTGSESHFVRCQESDDCDIGECKAGYCEVDGKRVTEQDIDEQDDPAGGSNSASRFDGGESTSDDPSAADPAGDNPAGDDPPTDDEAADDPAGADPNGQTSNDPASNDPASNEQSSGSNSSDPPMQGSNMSSAGDDPDGGSTQNSGAEEGGTPPTPSTSATGVVPPPNDQRLTPCPDSVPTAGQACDELGLECTYGDDPRVRCRTHAACTFDGWWVETPSCPELTDLGQCALPAAELLRTECELDTYCGDGDSRCQCGECWVYTIEVCEGGYCDDYSEIRCEDTPLWHCDSQVQQGCAIDVPNIGAACGDSEPYCYYFEPVCGTRIGTGCFLGRINSTYPEPFGYGEDCDGRAVELADYCPPEPPEVGTLCSQGFRDPPALSCMYGDCERYQCGGQVWQGGILNEPECTDCGLLDAVCDDDNPCCNGFYCNRGSCLALQVCGNGVLDPIEVCDDGNTESGDGCSADCQQIEPGFSSASTP